MPMISFERDGYYVIKPEHHDPALIEFTPTDAVPGLKVLQGAVEGYIEGVDLADGGFQTKAGVPFGTIFTPQGAMARAYVNEEGKIRHMPVNQLATKLVAEHGFISDVIAGPMIVLVGKAMIESEEDTE
jgi:hypothetical protein